MAKLNDDELRASVSNLLAPSTNSSIMVNNVTKFIKNYGIDQRLDEAKQHPVLSESEENFRAAEFRITQLESELTALKDTQEVNNG